GAVVTMGLEIPALEDVEHLYQVDTPGGWRRHGDNFVTPVGAGHGFSFHHLVSGQILMADQAAISLHFSHNQVGRFTLVKTIGTLAGNAPEGSGQILLAPSLTRLPGFALGLEKIPLRRRMGAESLLGLHQ